MKINFLLFYFILGELFFLGCGQPTVKKKPDNKTQQNAVNQYADKTLQTLNKAKDLSLINALSQIQYALQTYYMDNDSFPQTLSDNFQELEGYLNIEKVFAKTSSYKIKSYRGNQLNYELVIETETAIHTVTPHNINSKDK